MLERQQLFQMEKPPVMEGEYSCVCPEELELEPTYPEFFENQAESSVSEETPSAPSEHKDESESESPDEDDIDPCKEFNVCRCKVDPDELEALKEQRRLEREQRRAEREAKKAAAESAPQKPPTPKSTKASEQTTSSSCVCESDLPAETKSSSVTIDFSVLANCDYSTQGWILVDVPEDAREAELLCKQGALPTHALMFIMESEEETGRDYKYLSLEWQNVYKSVPVQKVYVKGRHALVLAENVTKMLGVMPHRHAPMLPRIALIGSRGSGATTQAKMLSHKYGFVHVEFQEEMARALLRKDKFCKLYQMQLSLRPDPELEALLLEKILLTPKCRKRGWVLTGYPSNCDQLRMMDLMATPPNRIIFIDVPAKECFIRLYYRKTDWMTGKEYGIPDIEPYGLDGQNPVGVAPEVRERLMSHPRDNKKRIIRDIESYFDEKEEMMKYCGKTASVVNGNKSVETVFELIDQIIINPAPAQPPRNPLSINCGIEEAYEKMKTMRMDTGINTNNLMVNPPNPIFKL
ncbi:UNVERIFIED_CONTAM: hypothetical protein PYX00_003522 [Menopon gallinae]